MRLKHLFLLPIVCLSAAASTSAQSVPPPPPPTLPTPSPQSAVHVTTRIVQVSVIVKDASGKPVKGLTKDDFVLLDQGQRQQIASVSEGTRSFAATGAAAGPNHFTNQLAPGDGGAPPLTVIVIDAYNTEYYDQYWRPGPPGYHCAPGSCPQQLLGSIFKQVEKFVARMQPQDRVALYVLTQELYLLQDFTNDAGALERGINQGKEYASTLNYPECSGTDPNEMSTRTMAAMHSIADRLAKIPGRKNLMWLSSGFHYLQVITEQKMDKSAKALGDEELPLFAIDAHGLVAPLAVPGRGSQGGGGMTSGVDLPTPARSDPRLFFCDDPPPGGFSAIRTLSEDSGGRAFYNTNDFAGAIRRVIDDSSASYVLSYYPDHNKWNGEFHEIKVKVNRRGMEVHARRGYYAVVDTASAPQKDAERLAEAIQSPVESTDLPFDVQADAIDTSGARQLKVKITIDANQLRFQQQSDRWTDNLSEVWAEFNAEGKQVGEISKTIDLTHNEDEHKKMIQDGFTYSKTLVLAKDATEVRLILRDTGNGAIGSVIIPLSRLFPSAAAQTQTKN
jgi:VWFA-related protein